MGTPLGTQGEHANSTQKRPIADPGQGMGTDDMEERTQHTVDSLRNHYGNVYHYVPELFLRVPASIRRRSSVPSRSDYDVSPAVLW